MNKTNIGLVEYVKSKLNLPTMYFLSGFGRVLTEYAIQKRINNGDQFTIDNAKIIRTGIGRYGFDCVGLIKGYLWEESVGVVDYNIPVGSDQNSQGMYDKAIQKGSLATMPDILGLLVFTGDLGHVGVYVGKVNGIRQYVECTPAWNVWGVTTSADSGSAHSRKWTYWGKYHLIDYITEPVAITYAPMIDVSNKQYIATDGVWIRQLPTINSPRLPLLPMNTLVDVLQISTAMQDGYNWVKIVYQGITGYCAIVSEATVTDKVIVTEPIVTPIEVVTPEPIIEPIKEPEIVIPIIVEPEPIVTEKPIIIPEPITEHTTIVIPEPITNTNETQITHHEPVNVLYGIIEWIIKIIKLILKGK